MKGIAFIKDPDGYLVEIVPLAGSQIKKEVDCLGALLEAPAVYVDNSKWETLKEFNMQTNL